MMANAGGSPGQPTTSTTLSAEASPHPSTPEAPLLVAVGLNSFSALLLELSLTRLFSVVLFYHFAFLAISVALLGLGAGGVFAYLRRSWLLRRDTRTLAATLSLWGAVAVAVALEVVLHSPVHLELSWSNFGALSLIYVFTAVPFFVTGVLFAMVFARNPSRISRLYGADLTGGALACLLTVPLLNSIGAPNSVLFAAMTMAIASLVWHLRHRWRWAAVGITALLGVIIALNTYSPFIDVIYAKGSRRDRARTEYARWNAISRVEVDREKDGSVYIVIDADANSAIMNVDPYHWRATPWTASLMASAAAMPNVLRPSGDYAIIGPGGGVDVLRAVANGSRKVTGIEINPLIANDIMRGHFAAFAHHLYEIPEVRIHVTDGRSFIRNSRDRYDVIQMTLVDTWASTSAGAFALSENNLYTVNAFQEYFEHLKPDGMIAVTRWEFQQPREALRVVSVALEALHRLGAEDPRRNFMVISDGPLNTDGRPVLVLAKRTPFTADEEAMAIRHIREHSNLVAQYVPSAPPSNPFTELIVSNDSHRFADRYAFNVRPVDDNSPFFFFTLKLSQVLSRQVGRGMDWKVNVGVAVLGIVLLLSLAAVAAFLILPLMIRTRARQARVAPLLYFVAIGLGYILVEITFIQRFVLFLGHPTYALTVVVFLMLLSSGMGSLLSRRWVPRGVPARWPLLLIVLVIVAYVFLLPLLLPRLVGLPFAAKLMMSGLLLAPLGLVMGLPFPMGLGALAGALPVEAREVVTDNAVEWAWAINAAASVLGSVLTMVVAIQFGLNVTLACGAAAYLAALLLAGTLAGGAPAYNPRLISRSAN
jgi:hypothetical protein